MDHQIIEIKKGISFGARSGSIIEVTKEEVEPDAKLQFDSGTKQWAIAGSDNDRPQKIVDENMQDGTSAGALGFKIRAHYGGGPYFYTKRIKKDKEIPVPVLFEDLPDEIQDFWWANDCENFIQGIISDYEWWNTYYVQYILSKTGKVLEIDWKRFVDVRVAKRNKQSGLIDNFFLSRNWPSPSESEYATIQSFNKKRPETTPNGIYRHVMVSIDKDYYITPHWQSNLKWLAVAKKIPEWINANIDNSINIKYHIEIPESYFIRLYPQERYGSDQEWKDVLIKAETDLKKQIDDFLAGAKNVGKTFYTKFALDETGEVIPGWKITPIPNDIKDGAWLNAYGTGAAAIATAHGVPPSLQGLILASGLGTGSGSDVREQFNYYLQLNTVIPRQTTTEWFELVKRINKWDPKLHLGYKNIILQSVNENKSGFIIQNEPNPTSPAK